jgi:hypothetical protein
MRFKKKMRKEREGGCVPFLIDGDGSAILLFYLFIFPLFLVYY